MESMSDIVKDFKESTKYAMYNQLDVKAIVSKIREFIGQKKEEILLAWWAEHGFEPGKAVLVEERGPEFKIYIRESTSEEQELVESTIGQVKVGSKEKIVEEMLSLAAEPTKSGFIPIFPETLRKWVMEINE